MSNSNLKNKIINGDSLKELKKIPSETFDLVFADPPYNLQLKNELIGPVKTLGLLSAITFCLTLLLSRLLPYQFKTPFILGLVLTNYGIVITVLTLALTGIYTVQTDYSAAHADISLSKFHFLIFFLALGVFLYVRSKKDQL